MFKIYSLQLFRHFFWCSKIISQINLVFLRFRFIKNMVYNL